MTDKQQDKDEPVQIEAGGHFEGEGFIKRADGEVIPFRFSTGPLEKSED